MNKKQLTPLKRVLKAIAFLKVDQVPIVFFINPDVLADFMGVTVKKYLSNVDLQLEGCQKFRERFPGALAGVSIHQPYATAQAFGCAVSDQEDAIPAICSRVIDKPEGVEFLKIPEPWEAKGTRDWLEKIEYQEERGIKMPGIGEFGPVELAGQIYGYHRFLSDIRRRPKTIHKLLEKTLEFVIKFQMAWIKLIGGWAPIIFISDHVCSLMNKKIVDEFYSPYHKKLTKALKPYCGGLFYHNENRSDHIIKEIGEWGYSMFHGQDWAINGSLRKTKEIVSNLPSDKKYVLVGQVPGVDIVLREPSDDILKQKVIENIQIYAPGGGYIFSTGAGIIRGIPLRRIDMMIELVEKYGRYKNKYELYEPDEK